MIATAVPDQQPAAAIALSMYGIHNPPAWLTAAQRLLAVEAYMRALRDLRRARAPQSYIALFTEIFEQRCGLKERVPETRAYLMAVMGVSNPKTVSRAHAWLWRRKFMWRDNATRRSLGTLMVEKKYLPWGRGFWTDRPAPGPGVLGHKCPTRRYKENSSAVPAEDTLPYSAPPRPAAAPPTPSEQPLRPLRTPAARALFEKYARRLDPASPGGPPRPPATEEAEAPRTAPPNRSAPARINVPTASWPNGSNGLLKSAVVTLTNGDKRPRQPRGANSGASPKVPSVIDKLLDGPPLLWIDELQELLERTKRGPPG